MCIISCVIVIPGNIAKLVRLRIANPSFPSSSLGVVCSFFYYRRRKKILTKIKNKTFKVLRGYGGMVVTTDLKSVDLFSRKGSSPFNPNNIANYFLKRYDITS